MAPYEDELDSLVHELNRQAAAPVSTADNPSSSSAASGRLEQPRLAEILRQAVANGASDILLVPGAGIAERIQGSIRMSGGDPLTDTDVRGMVMPLLNPADLKRLRDTLSADFAFQSRTGRRFRINVHHQRQTLAAAIRLLPRDVPRLADLDLPPALQQIATLRRGLVLVAGPTGAGKSSTLAALVEEMNRSRACHIVTVEDPVEFVHTNRMALVEQIEVGIDTPGFNDCLRSILRQSPDVILVGEMRDPETVMLALTAAETGHLVLSTLHTHDSAQAISRMVDTAPAASQPQIRQQLSLSLAAIVSQQLVPGARGERRYAACEILLGSDGVRNLIRSGQDHQLKSQILLSRSSGMITMDYALAELASNGKITPEVALSHGYSREELRSLLGGGRR